MSERSEDVTVGLVGCGHIMPAHVSAWQSARGARLLGFHDRDPAKTAATAAAHPGTRAFESLDAMLDHCELVDLCTPPQAHREGALAAIRRGRHVFVEKPAFDTVAAWEEVRDAAERADVRLCVSHQHKYDLHTQKALRWVAEGRIGPVIDVSFDFLVDPHSDDPLESRVPWIGALPGGRWFEVLPHLLYLMRLFTGTLRPGPVSALRTASAPHSVWADEVAALFEGDGCLATLRLSARSHQDDRTLTVRGTDGTIEVSVLRGVATLTSLSRARKVRGAGLVGVPFLEAGSKLAQWAPDRVRHLAGRRGLSNHARLSEAVVRAVRGTGPNPTPIDEIDDVMRCCEAVGQGIEAARAATSR